MSQPAAKLCRHCRCPWTSVRNVDTGKAVFLDLRSPVYVAYRNERGQLACRQAGAWLWKAMDAAPPMAAAMTAFGSEIDAPILEQLEAVEGFYASHMNTCPATVKGPPAPAAQAAPA